MNNEEYGIVLNLITDKFNKKMSDIKLKMAELTRTLSDLKSERKYLQPGTEAFKEYTNQIIKTEDELNSLKQRLKDTSNENQNTFSKMGKSMSNSIGTVMKKMGKWLIAIFGIRTAYMGIRKAVSILSQYNQQLSTDISYISYALAKTVEPIINAVVNIVYKVLGYINSIAIKLFNVNLFAKATAKSFANANSSAKSLSKTLAGFDTITNLSGDSNNLATGISMPSYDLSKSIKTDIDWANVGKKLVNGAKKALSKLNTFLTGYDWAGLGTKIWNKFASLDWIGLAKELVKSMLTLGSSFLEFCWGILKGEVQTLRNKIIEGLDNIGIKLGLKSRIWEDIVKPKIDDLKEKLKNVIEIKLGLNASKLKEKLKSIFSSVGYTLLKLLYPSLAGLSVIKSWINSFDVGTNYVPNDQLAMVHKGEMIVPKKYNPATSGIGGNNEELLNAIYSLQDTLERKQFNAYLDGNKITNSVVDNINYQSRVMGRSIIQ